MGGHSVKRVPLDFDWPMQEIWIGYQDPYYSRASECRWHEYASQAWQPIEPPTGEAWQLWENISEGAPISPPCESAEALARWLEKNALWPQDKGRSCETWLKFILSGKSAPSLYVSGSSVQDGVDAIAAGDI